jgi:adenylyltransferase/sulfurtransferase
VPRRADHAPNVAPAPAPADVELDAEERSRYARHIVLKEVGLDGQKRLKQAGVLLVGAGGLGSPLALYLAAAGVGRIGLVDHDRVDRTNLQRQVVHGSGDVGRRKVESAAARLNDLNPHAMVEPHPVRLTAANALDLVGRYDVIVDGSDNFPTRYLVSDACVLLGKPNVYGSIYRFEGQASLFWAGRGPCYRCLYPEPPPPGLAPSCAEAGVLGVLPGIIGTIQATETVKLILGRGESLLGRLLLFDALAMRFRELRLRQDPRCPACGERPTITGLVDYDQVCDVAAPGAAGPGEIDVHALKALLDRGEPVQVVDVRNHDEWDLCRLEGSLLVPLPELGARLGEVARDRDVVVLCKMGGRSAQAADILRRAGFERVRNLKGGIDAWAEGVDPAMPRY